MKKPKFIRILSIDGGGIRGIIPGKILVKLEEKLNDLKPGARIADYFDLITGTSTGGILTCALLCPDENDAKKPKFTAQEVLDLYLNNGSKIFELKRKRKWYTLWGIRDEKYSQNNIEEILKRYFGEVKLSQLLKPCVVTSYDIERRHGHFFMQHEAKIKKGYDFKIADVARATSAAPTYFECAQVYSEEEVSCALIDGGVFVNNPALCGYAEARELFKARAKDMLILSLGTGGVKKSYDYNKAKKWGMVGWLRPLIDIMMSGVAEVVDHQLEQIYEAVERKEQYIRIEEELPEAFKVDPAMDNASDKNIKALAEHGADIATRKEDELAKIAAMLTEEVEENS